MISNTSKGHDQQCKKLMFIYLFSIKFYNNKEDIRSTLAKEAKGTKKRKNSIIIPKLTWQKFSCPKYFGLSLVATFVSKLTAVSDVLAAEHLLPLSILG